jgi:Raf kinase inhibitor-like YbhB/YbcL family protein
MQLTSPAFKQGSEIPSYYTNDGENVSPELSWKDAPANTKSFALVVHDPDAPRTGGFTHWVLYNIPAETTHLNEKIANEEQIKGVGLQGQNDRGKIGYIGPAPPSGTHRYFFRLFAIDKILDLAPGATHQQVSSAIKGHILAQAELMGTYEKKSERAA